MVGMQALHADKDRKRLAKAMTSLQHEREKELEDERAESSAVGKAELAEQDEVLTHLHAKHACLISRWLLQDSSTQPEP
jgi:hypothetical protein